MILIRLVSIPLFVLSIALLRTTFSVNAHILRLNTPNLGLFRKLILSNEVLYTFLPTSHLHPSPKYYCVCMRTVWKYYLLTYSQV